jgi:molybdopterin synthase catalytic subunit
MSLGFLDLPAPALPAHENTHTQMGEVFRAGKRAANMGNILALQMPAMTNPRVRIQTADFNLAAEIESLRVGDARVGAVCSFVGTVRDRNDGLAVSSMELEHYPGMTEKAIEAMMDEALQRFDIHGARVIHRVGLLQPMDQVVMVAVTSAHRGESFRACEFLMDYLKTQAPFWKKEQTPDGARWVDARVTDDQALARWGIEAPNLSNH